MGKNSFIMVKMKIEVKNKENGEAQREGKHCMGGRGGIETGINIDEMEKRGEEGWKGDRLIESEKRGNKQMFSLVGAHAPNEILPHRKSGHDWHFSDECGGQKCTCSEKRETSASSVNDLTFKMWDGMGGWGYEPLDSYCNHRWYWLSAMETKLNQSSKKRGGGGWYDISWRPTERNTTPFKPWHIELQKRLSSLFHSEVPFGSLFFYFIFLTRPLRVVETQKNAGVAGKWPFSGSFQS